MDSIPSVLRAMLLWPGFRYSPRDSLASILIERCYAAVKLGTLRPAQRQLMLFEAVPKLRDQRQPFGPRQPDNIHA